MPNVTAMKAKKKTIATGLGSPIRVCASAAAACRAKNITAAA
jgi:hypothetical protein